jgi:hypothetical protein
MTLPEQEPLPPAVNRLKQQVQKWRQAKDGRFAFLLIGLSPPKPGASESWAG